MADSVPSPRKRFVAMLILAAVGLILFLSLVISIFLGWRETNTASQQGSAGVGSEGGGPRVSLQGLSASSPNRRYLTCQCTDLQSNLWVGGEGGGVWRFDPTGNDGKQWKQFSVPDGLGDEDITALACDRKGRIWAGQGRSGVSVWNGAAWRNYGVTSKSSGPIGEHVFSIAVCPVDGDVWMATSAGITRYSESSDRWIDYTRADGLPSDLAASIAFNPAGDIFIATQCNGLAIARASNKYASWQHIDGPDQFLTNPTGEGLPSNRLNDVLALDSDHIFVASPEGLGWSVDGGAHWRYLHGEDWPAKMLARAGGPQSTQQPIDPIDSAQLLPEDYVTSLTVNSSKIVQAVCRSGLVQVLQRGNDLEVGRNVTKVDFARAPHQLTDFQTASSYGAGLVVLGDSQVKVDPNARAAAAPAFPSSASPPDLAELNRELVEISHVPALQLSSQPVVESLADDWATRGDWIGRYGRYQCAIAAIAQPDYRWGAAPDPIQYLVTVGPHRKQNDSNRYWIATLYTTDPRVLELPPVYLHSRVLRKLTTWDKNRRQAEWNDNGEEYETTWDGPDLYCNVDVPDGLFNLSFYEINDNAHPSATSAQRDFEMLVKSRDGDVHQPFTGPEFDAAPVLARARIVNFWSGVYKRFVVQGPTKLTVKICRDYSPTCAVTSALMLDLVDPKPMPYFATPEEWAQTIAARRTHNGAMTSGQIDWSATCTACDSERDAVTKLMLKLDELRDWNPQWLALNERRIAIGLARWCQDPAKLDAADQTAMELKAASFYAAGNYPEYENAQTAAGDKTSRAIEKALRWDGKSNVGGHEYDVLTNDVAALKLTEDPPPTTRRVIRRSPTSLPG